MKEGMHIVVAHHCSGEGVDFVRDITIEQFKQIEEIIGEDLFDDLTMEHSIKICLQTPEQHRQSLISGTAFGEGCSLEQARRIVDEEELLSDEDEEAQQDKEWKELDSKEA